MSVKKPAVKKPAVKKPAVKKPVAKKPVAKKPAAKKPVAKKPAAKKPAAKKPAAKKPAAKKPAAKKPAAKMPTVKMPTVQPIHVDEFTDLSGETIIRDIMGKMNREGNLEFDEVIPRDQELYDIVKSIPDDIRKKYPIYDYNVCASCNVKYMTDLKIYQDVVKTSMRFIIDNNLFETIYRHGQNFKKTKEEFKIDNWPKSKYEITVYRGQQNETNNFNNGKFSTLSTTVNINTTAIFGNIIYRIKLSPGTPLLAIRTLSDLPTEEEILLPKELNYKFMPYSGEKFHGRKVIDVVV